MKGKLLFIDEAYSLLDGRRSDFGDEAINTIVQEIENNRQDTVVIFAGYPKEMDDFFKSNPGLRSRVPFTINFCDYSCEEMTQIVEL
ncbi:MAG: AAA family ATPase, partial [Eubacteriales bacterium]